jgi:hypothetical protein
MDTLSLDNMAAQLGFVITLAYQYVTQPIMILLLVAAVFLAWQFFSPKR